MKPDMEKELETAVKSATPLGEIVVLLRNFKNQGVPQAEVYAYLERLHRAAPDEATDDRILEIADFVAGFCAPHMKIWDGERTEPTPR